MLPSSSYTILDWAAISSASCATLFSSWISSSDLLVTSSSSSSPLLMQSHLCLRIHVSISTLASSSLHPLTTQYFGPLASRAHSFSDSEISSSFSQTITGPEGSSGVTFTFFSNILHFSNSFTSSGNLKLSSSPPYFFTRPITLLSCILLAFSLLVLQ